MAEPTPAEKAVGYLKAELPGFAAELVPGTDTFRVKGMFRFGAAMTAESLVYAVADDDRVAKVMLDRLIDMTRRKAIESLGIRKLIDAELEHARRFARAEGRREGIEVGRAEGRREVFDLIIEAQKRNEEGDELDG